MLRLVIGLVVLVSLFASGCAATQSHARPVSFVREAELSRHFSLAHVSIHATVQEHANGALRSSLWIITSEPNRSSTERLYGCTAHQEPGSSSLRCDLDETSNLADWRALLNLLEHFALEGAPAIEPRVTEDESTGYLRLTGCYDGTPWQVSFRRVRPAVVLVAKQACGPQSPARQAFERQIDSLITAIDAAARRS